MCTASTLTGSALSRLQQQFNAHLPVMRRAIAYHLRRVAKRFRDEFEADVLAACWHAWAGLARRGQDPVSVGPAGIVTNAVRYVLAGRRLGTGTAGHGAADVYSRMGRQDGGLSLVSLDQPAGNEVSDRPVRWRDLLTHNNRFGPADEAAFALDFQAWLTGLSARKREMAELLVEGHETGVVARQLGVTPAAVSIARSDLQVSWARFQSHDAAKSDALQRRPAGDESARVRPQRRAVAGVC